MRIESRDRLETLRAQARESNASRAQQVLVCCGTGCLAWGSKKVAEAFASEIAKRSIDATVNPRSNLSPGEEIPRMSRICCPVIPV